VLLVVALICALMLMSPRYRGDQEVPEPIPLPAYLLYLLFLSVGFYFAARGHTSSAANVSPPLWLPRGSIRLLILAALTATIVYKVVTDREGLEAQLKASVEPIRDQPLLPLVVLGGFFVGVVVRAVIGRRERSAWAQTMEAWFSLVSVVLMSVAVLIHLVIDPSLATRLYLPTWEAFLAGVVAFYFGVRS
jgi:hypothetical protein